MTLIWWIMLLWKNVNVMCYWCYSDNVKPDGENIELTDKPEGDKPEGESFTAVIIITITTISIW